MKPQGSSLMKESCPVCCLCQGVEKPVPPLRARLLSWGAATCPPAQSAQSPQSVQAPSVLSGHQAMHHRPFSDLRFQQPQGHPTPRGDISLLRPDMSTVGPLLPTDLVSVSAPNPGMAPTSPLCPSLQCRMETKPLRCMLFPPLSVCTAVGQLTTFLGSCKVPTPPGRHIWSQCYSGSVWHCGHSSLLMQTTDGSPLPMSDSKVLGQHPRPSTAGPLPLQPMSPLLLTAHSRPIRFSL